MKRFYSAVTLICVTLFLFAGNLSAQSFTTGKIGVALSNAGRIRILKADNTTRMADRISILVGGKTDQVFDYYNDADSVKGFGGSKTVASPAKSNFEVVVAVDNLYGDHQDPKEAVYPPNVRVDYNIYGWTNQPYVIVKAVVKNQETTSLDAKFGLEFIPQIDGNYGFETTKYYTTEKAVGIYVGTSSAKLGFKMLSQDVTTVKTIDWVDGYNSSESDLQKWISTGTLESSYTTTSADGIVSFIGVAASQLAAGATKTYYFALGIGDDEAKMLTAISDAKTKYASTFTAIEKTKELPGNFNLSQNYPNPFNPSTKINFAVPSRNNVSLKVYNTLGQQVAELVNQALEAGSYSVDFNAGSLPSGVYVYTLTNGLSKVSNKMMLIK